MKIKSWTGDEVDARVGMVVNYHLDLEAEGHLDYESVIEGFDGDKYVYLRNIGKALPEELTMLHCPFQVGDEIEICDIGERGTYWDKSIFSEIHQMMIDVGHEYKGKTYLELIRHTNPSLRTSEEYKV